MVAIVSNTQMQSHSVLHDTLVGCIDILMNPFLKILRSLRMMLENLFFQLSPKEKNTRA